MQLRCNLLPLILLVSAVWTQTAETPIPPAPVRRVTDTASFISPQTAQALEARLAAYEQGTGHQILVYIGSTTGNVPIEDWGVRAFEAWRVGRSGIDDGLVLFIMSQDRKLRIEVGYGLEGQVPDALASRVINEVIVPRIQAGNPDAAVTAGIDALVGIIGGDAAGAQAASQPGRARQALSRWQLAGYGIAAIVLLILLITNPSLAIYLLASILSGGNRRGGGFGGGGFGGGGGFSGGGGRSGGGGASGSW